MDWESLILFSPNQEYGRSNLSMYSRQAVNYGPVDPSNCTSLTLQSPRGSNERHNHKLPEVALQQSKIAEARSEAELGAKKLPGTKQLPEQKIGPRQNHEALVERNPRRTMKRNLGVNNRELPNSVSLETRQHPAYGCSSVMGQHKVVAQIELVYQGSEYFCSSLYAEVSLLRPPRFSASGKVRQITREVFFQQRYQPAKSYAGEGPAVQKKQRIARADLPKCDSCGSCCNIVQGRTQKLL